MALDFEDHEINMYPQTVPFSPFCIAKNDNIFNRSHIKLHRIYIHKNSGKKKGLQRLYKLKRLKTKYSNNHLSFKTTALKLNCDRSTGS